MAGQTPDPVSSEEPSSHLLPDMAWSGYGNADLFQDTAARIAQLESQLAGPPEDAGLTAYTIQVYTLAGLYWAKHDGAAALVRFQQAAELAENRLPKTFQAWCWNGTGDAHADFGEYEQAVKAYRRAAELDPASAYAWMGIAGVQGNLLAQPDEAIAAYRRALSVGGLNPHLIAIIHNGLGNVYYLQERMNEAIAAYRMAIQTDPGFLSPYDNLGALAMKQGDLPAARLYFEERVRLRPQHALNAYVSLGIIARRIGDPAAENWFRQALEAVEPAWSAKYETPAGILEKKALALAGLGRRSEALAALDEMLQQCALGDVIELFRYELLQAAPNPPDGIREMIARLEKAVPGGYAA